MKTTPQNTPQKIHPENKFWANWFKEIRTDQKAKAKKQEEADKALAKIISPCTPRDILGDHQY